MYRIDDATAATSLPVPEAALAEGFFTEGNAAAGTPATNVRGSWLNMIQEELRAIVVAAGLTPSKTSYTQVLTALQALFAGSAQIGALQAIKQITVPYTVIASDKNKMLVASGTGAVTIPTGIIPAGSTLVVSAASNTDAVTVTPPAGGFFAYGGQQSSTINLGNNESVSLVGFTNTVLVVASGGLRSSNDFGFLSGTSGWMQLPNDFVFQWGQATTSASADVGVTFPRAYKTAAYTVHANIDSQVAGYAVAVNTLGLTAFAMSSYSSASTRAAANTHWFSIGK